MSQVTSTLNGWAVIVLAFLGVVLAGAITSLQVPRARNFLINQAVGTLVVAATEKRREEGLNVRLREKRMERIREAHDDLSQWIMGKGDSAPKSGVYRHS